MATSHFEKLPLLTFEHAERALLDALALLKNDCTNRISPASIQRVIHYELWKIIEELVVIECPTLRPKASVPPRMQRGPTPALPGEIPPWLAREACTPAKKSRQRPLQRLDDSNARQVATSNLGQ